MSRRFELGFPEWDGFKRLGPVDLGLIGSQSRGRKGREQGTRE